MNASNKDFGMSQDMLQTSVRWNYEQRILAGTLILGVDAASVQYFDNGGAVRTIKLPLAAPRGRVWFLVNFAGGAFALTITDDADAAIAGGTLTAGQTGVYQKVGAVYLKMGEWPVPA